MSSGSRLVSWESDYWLTRRFPDRHGGTSRPGWGPTEATGRQWHGSHFVLVGLHA